MQPSSEWFYAIRVVPGSIGACATFLRVVPGSIGVCATFLRVVLCYQSGSW